MGSALAAPERCPGDVGGSASPEEPCRSCDEECCLAMGVAIAGHAALWTGAPAPPRTPALSRVSLRREGYELFRPPLA